MNQNYRFMELSQFCTPLHWSAHGVVGGASAEAQGGKFGQGFISVAFTKAVSTQGLLPGKQGGLSIERLAGHAVVGGTASALSGGKFANGAQTAAYGYLFNELSIRGTVQEKRELQKAVDKLKEGSKSAKEVFDMLKNTNVSIRKTSGANRYRPIDQTILLNPDAASINAKTPFIVVIAHEAFHVLRHVFGILLHDFPTGDIFALMGENAVRKDLNLPNRDYYECIPGHKDC